MFPFICKDCTSSRFVFTDRVPRSGLQQLLRQPDPVRLPLPAVQDRVQERVVLPLLLPERIPAWPADSSSSQGRDGDGSPEQCQHQSDSVITCISTSSSLSCRVTSTVLSHINVVHLSLQLELLILRAESWKCFELFIMIIIESVDIKDYFEKK